MRHATAEKRSLSVAETCHTGNFGRTSFYKFVSTGLLPARKLGRKTVVLQADLDRFLETLPAVSVGIEQPDAVVGRSENLNRTAFAPRPPKGSKQRPAVVSKVPLGKVQGRALRPARSVRSAGKRRVRPMSEPAP